MNRTAAPLPKPSTRRRAAVPSAVHETLRAGGRPLDTATRAVMEPRFGHDFSRVRIHADTRAAASAEAVHSRAYTVGGDIVFAAGAYAPGTAEGRRLLAHELTHVLQQPRGLQGKLEIGEPGDRHERQAERTAQQVTRPMTSDTPAVEPRHTLAAPRLMRQAAPARARPAGPDLDTLLDKLGELRFTLSPEEFHFLIGRLEDALYPVLHPFRWLGVRARPGDTIREFDAAYRRRITAAADAGTGPAAGAARPADDEQARRRLYEVMASDPIAAAFIGSALAIEATAGRAFGFELDPRRSAAGAQATSLLTQVAGAAGGRTARPTTPPPRGTLRGVRSKVAGVAMRVTTGIQTAVPSPPFGATEPPAAVAGASTPARTAPAPRAAPRVPTPPSTRTPRAPTQAAAPAAALPAPATPRTAPPTATPAEGDVRPAGPPPVRTPQSITAGGTIGGIGAYQEKVPPPIPLGRGFNEVLGNAIGDETTARAVLRRLANGDATALQVLGVTAPPGYVPSGREWGLGRTPSGDFVIIQGGTGGVSWEKALAQKIVPLAHSHPRLASRALTRPGVTLTELLKGGSLDAMFVLPSVEDTAFSRKHGPHVVEVPYSSVGGLAIGDAGVGDPISFHISGASRLGWIRGRGVVHTAMLTMVVDGKPVWSGPVWAVGDQAVVQGDAPTERIIPFPTGTP